MKIALESGLWRGHLTQIRRTPDEHVNRRVPG